MGKPASAYLKSQPQSSKTGSQVHYKSIKQSYRGCAEPEVRGIQRGTQWRRTLPALLATKARPSPAVSPFLAATETVSLFLLFSTTLILATKFLNQRTKDAVLGWLPWPPWRPAKVALSGSVRGANRLQCIKVFEKVRVVDLWAWLKHDLGPAVPQSCPRCIRGVNLDADGEKLCGCIAREVRSRTCVASSHHFVIFTSMMPTFTAVCNNSPFECHLNLSIIIYRQMFAIVRCVFTLILLIMEFGHHWGVFWGQSHHLSCVWHHVKEHVCWAKHLWGFLLDLDFIPVLLAFKSAVWWVIGMQWRICSCGGMSGNQVLCSQPSHLGTFCWSGAMSASSSLSATCCF